MSGKRLLIPLFFCLAAFALQAMVPVARAGWDEAQEDYENGNYVKAYEQFRTLAEQGNADAQWDLGTMYANGQGAPKDYAEAVKWFSKAAEQGLAGAQFNLGIMYYNGTGVPQDYAEAVKWFSRQRSRDSPTHNIIWESCSSMAQECRRILYGHICCSI